MTKGNVIVRQRPRDLSGTVDHSKVVQKSLLNVNELGQSRRLAATLAPKYKNQVLSVTGLVLLVVHR